MKLITNIVLILLVIFLFLWLASTIYSPINFKQERTKRENAVRGKLEQIRDAQLAFRGITGKYAHDFDTLREVLTTDTFLLISIKGNPDEEVDGGIAIVRDTFYKPAIDSMRILGINLDSLAFVPYGKGEKFKVESTIITYQKMQVPVMEVKVGLSKYMGPYSDPKYKRFDPGYDPLQQVRKIGDLTTPSTSGNWGN